MSDLHEQLSAQFHRWERRGRGWQVFGQPVQPEPTFAPIGHFWRPATVGDDGRKPTFLSRMLRTAGQRLAQTPPPAPATEPPQNEEEEPSIFPLERGLLTELPLFLPKDHDARTQVFDQMLGSVSCCREPLAFELLGTPAQITAQFVAHPQDAAALRQQMQAFFPTVPCIPRDPELPAVWNACEEAESAVIELGLGDYFLKPLAQNRTDILIPLIGALSSLEEGEFGLYQVIFQPVINKWADGIREAVTGADGRAMFVNESSLANEAERKISRQLYAAVVRLCARSPDFDRAWEIVRGMAGALRELSQPGSNELIPLRNDGYPPKAHIEDVLRRQSRRTGMILNRDELLSLVHVPTAGAHSPKLLHSSGRSKAAPDAVNQEDGLFLGWNRHLGQERGVWLTPEHRVRHLHVVGAPGTGKSTLLFNLIRQDIETGQGVAVLDPHGDLIDQILGIIPPERIGDVILLDPSDEQFSVGFNILSAHSDWEKNLLASDLVSIFRRLSTSWGDQMGSVLQNAILAFLESPDGGTLADLRRFLLEPAFREKVLLTVRDPDLVYYWKKGFSQLTGNKSIGPVITRLETFLSPKPIRYIVAQPANRLDFSDILDSGKIFLARLAQGSMGLENAYLLGSLLVTKFQQTAMGRQRQAGSKRKDFWLYLDEFHNFITPSLAEILTGARKYRLGLVMAHQELRQLQRDPEVAGAVLSTVGTRICFRVGDQDARALENGFASFEARDLQNLEQGEAVVRVERSENDFNLSVPWPELPEEDEAAERRQEVITASRKKYAVPRAEVEAALYARMQEPIASPPAKPASPPPPAPAPPPPVVVALSPPVPPPVAPVPLVTKQDDLSADLGRGGNQHKTIQKRLQAAAEALGFRATIEKTILDGKGCVDLAIERPGLSIACEITVTTTIDHEVGNVAKCLKADFQQVAVVSGSVAKLAQLEAAVVNSLGPNMAARVRYFSPDDFIAHLKTLPPEPPAPTAPPAPASARTKTFRGYKVTTKVPQLSPEENRAREQLAIKVIAEAMQRRMP